ncbi:MAG TPA: right-handed parallel beta-helix repeat-containing protein [Pirellulales bacterium]|nr:right-handed parallel beta-helix repeat-containing protein [Pirellulales bacterium]
MLSFSGSRFSARKSLRRRVTPAAAVETLEERTLLSAFTVLNLNDHGAGSLRQAILDANSNPGADVINFNVAGTITLASAFPTIIGQVNIDGTTAPGFAGTPAVEVNFHNFGGLQFLAFDDGSALRSLSLVGASGNAVTLEHVENMQIVGNYIGLDTDGTTAAGNRGDGIELIGSSNNTIGGAAAEDRNVISANGQQGILLSLSSNNTITNNDIGTDATGTVALGNAANGILVTSFSEGNLIGGEVTGGNDPTQDVFVRPPDGNLISGNSANGVLINNRATNNQLSGNFIGTDASGNAPLGNHVNGVAIVQANNNSLLGCTIHTNPFVFYNVVSGNGANGLLVNNANGTTIQANFFGMGANNNTAVGNALNGVVVEGTSSHTTMGGPIPLGNVDAANRQNGIVVSNTASYFTSYNTFCGLAAFSTNPNFGNGADGMLITSTGGNILIRTNVVTENGHDGIELSGAAQGVRVVGNIVGLNTSGFSAMGNVANGVEVDGTAHGDVIGGPQPTFNVIPQNAISSNGGNGVAIDGHAHGITVNNSFIGTDITGGQTRGNGGAGVYVGPGTSGNVIGSPLASLLTVISANQSDGVDLQGSNRNTVVGTLIGTDDNGTLPLGNLGDGIRVSNGSHNTIGGVAAPNGPRGPRNVIAFNALDGVFVQSGLSNGIHENSIYGNGGLGIDLAAGANLNQAAPVLSSVTTGPLAIQVSGTLTSKPKTAFTIEFFASDTTGPSGRIFLGLLKVKTNVAGLAAFTFNHPLPPAGANFITATATDPTNNTSEFSAAMS